MADHVETLMITLTETFVKNNPRAGELALQISKILEKEKYMVVMQTLAILIYISATQGKKTAAEAGLPGDAEDVMWKILKTFTIFCGAIVEDQPKTADEAVQL